MSVLFLKFCNAWVWRKNAQNSLGCKRKCDPIAQIQSTLTQSFISALVAKTALTNLLRLGSYLCHLYLGGHAKSQSQPLFLAKQQELKSLKSCLSRGQPIGERAYTSSVVCVYIEFRYDHQIAIRERQRPVESSTHHTISPWLVVDILVAMPSSQPKTLEIFPFSFYILLLNNLKIVHAILHYLIELRDSRIYGERVFKSALR